MLAGNSFQEGIYIKKMQVADCLHYIVRPYAPWELVVYTACKLVWNWPVRALVYNHPAWELVYNHPARELVYNCPVRELVFIHPSRELV